MGSFAVIDTETNWEDEVMSIGCCIADADTFGVISAKYHVLIPECEIGGMYYDALFPDTPVRPMLCSRDEAISDLLAWFFRYDVRHVFAYNARFDRSHLPELAMLNWYDIMHIAVYRQYNRMIPCSADCFSTGRLKRNYGVEPMLRLLSDDQTYHETHNALFDALDELQIMRLLGHGIEVYPSL